MIAYALILFFIILIYPLVSNQTFLAEKSGRLEKNHRIYILLVSFLLVAIAGLRGLSVGIDTFAYYDSFNLRKDLDFPQIFENAEIEQGYRLFEYVVGHFIGEFQVLLILVALLYIGMVSYNIHKYSSNLALSYIFFIGFGFYTFGMSTIRQTMAISLILIAFQYIYKEKLMKFLFLVALASTFHSTALIFLPSYWFNKFNLNKKTMAFFAIIAVSLLVFKGQFVELLLSYSYNEYNSIETGGDKLYWLLIFALSLGMIYRKQFMEKNAYNKYLFFMILATTMLFPITQIHPAVLRLNFYYSIFLMLYIPNLLTAIDNMMIRTVGILGFSSVAVLQFFINTIPNSELQEYLFFWQ